MPWKTLANNIVDTQWWYNLGDVGTTTNTTHHHPFQPGDHLCHTILIPLHELSQRAGLRFQSSKQVGRWAKILIHQFHLIDFVMEHENQYYGVYSHHGILMDSRRVLHMSSRYGLILSDLSLFSREGMPIERVHYPTILTSEERQAILNRAWNIYHNAGRGSFEYKLVDRNCEHVARYCRLGKWDSQQVGRMEKSIEKWFMDTLCEGLFLFMDTCSWAANLVLRDVELVLVVFMIFLFLTMMWLLFF
jgi:hypothetical protein